MRILFVVPYTPTRIRARPYRFIRTLGSLGHDITISTTWSSEAERTAVAELQTWPGVRAVVAERLPTWRSAWNCALAAPGRDPLQAHFSWSSRLNARNHRMSEEGAFDVVHVEHLRGVRYGLSLLDSLSDQTERPAMIWDAVDCISSLFQKTARSSLSRRARVAARLEFGRTQRLERRAVGKFDAVLVTSDTDRSDLLALASTSDGHSNANIEVVPNGIDLDDFCVDDQARTSDAVVMTGKMSYHANLTAAIWLVRTVMPMVWSRLPQTKVWIVGQDPPAQIEALADERVTITGEVEDVRPYLRSAAISVAPIRYGVGIQNKVLEALASGTPMVATSTAVSAIGARSGRDLLTADTPGDFADAIVALLTDSERRRQLSEAGRALVARRFDLKSVGLRLTAVYQEVLSHS